MDVFDALTLPATAAPRLRGGAAWTGCGSPEGIFHDTPHPAALRTWIRPVQAAARRKPSYRPQLFLALFFFPSSKLLLIFPPSTEFKGAWGSPSPTKAELLGRAVGSSVAHTSTPTSPKPLILSWEGCCPSIGMWSPKRKVPWDFPSASSWDVDGLFPAAVLQWGEDAAGELQVMMPKAEMWSSPGGAVPGEMFTRKSPGYPSARHFRGKGNIPLLCLLEGRISGREVTPCLAAPWSQCLHCCPQP